MPICTKILPCAPATIAAWLLCFTTASASSSSGSWWRFSACRGRSWRSIGTSLRPARTSAAHSAPPAAFMSRHVVDCGPCHRPETSLFRAGSEPPPESLLKALRSAHARGARLVSICSGAFVIAATGLLDGKRATTHWRYAEELASRFPKIRVDPGVLYVDEGSILTSAGSAAGIDLCLHIVRCDYGAEIANRVARRLVMPPHRDGGQAQYVQNPVDSRAPGRLAPLMQWAQSHLGQALRVEDLARRAAMSPRTFARQFRQQTGTSPHQWLTHQRLLAAQMRLQKTDERIDAISEEVG